MKIIKFLFESCDTWIEKMILMSWIIVYFIDVIFPIYFILNNIAVIFSINYGLFYFTDSRTGFLVGFITCVLTVFFKYFRRIRDIKIWYYLAFFMIIFLAGFSLSFLQWNFVEYDDLHSCPEYVYVVNDLLIGRIHQAIRFTQGIEISPFGTRQSGVYCDMGYIKFFLQEGFIIYFLYIIAVGRLLFEQQKRKDYAGYIIIVAISARMLMESSFVPFVFQNVILMLFIGNWTELVKGKKDGKQIEV